MSDIMKLLEAVAVRLQAKTTQEAFMSVIKIKEIADQQLQQAHRAGFEEGKKQAAQEIADWLRDDIYSIESNYLQNSKYKAILFFVSEELRQRYGLEGVRDE